MQRLIIFILSVMLLLATGARAEVTHMNCKFNEGWHKKGGYREDAKSRKDLTLSWDKEKRIIKDTDRNFEPINKGRLGSTQEWRIEKPKKHYY